MYAVLAIESSTRHLMRLQNCEKAMGWCTEEEEEEEDFGHLATF